MRSSQTLRSSSQNSLPNDHGAAVPNHREKVTREALAPRTTSSFRHNGESHLDGDELVYWVSGAAEIAIERKDGSWTGPLLTQGEAVVVPQGIRHRRVVKQPCRQLFISSGRTEIGPAT
jgi:hypothetical protein